MAKSKVNNEDLEMQQDAVETPTVDDGSNGREAEEITVNVAPKKVKIHVTESTDCIISCVPYHFEKNKAYSVPADVAAILCYGEKAYRI